SPVSAQARAEPLPELIPMVAPRGVTTAAELRRRTDAPVFTVSRTVARSLGSTASPDRFPWKILVLTDGQAQTLSSAVPERAIHRLTSKADLDFVRRIVDRRIRTREVSIDAPSGGAWSGRVVVTSYLEGPLPDWGPGVPFCVVGPHGVVELGGIDGHVVNVTGGREMTKPRTLATAFALPRVALTIHDSTDGKLDESHVRAALEAAHPLAVPPDGGEVDGPLLAELLGALGVPQLVLADGTIRTEVALPLGWPRDVRQAPLARTTTGPLTLDRLEGALGRPETFSVPDLGALLALDGLERRLGYGHLTHPELEARPLFGAGRFGDRWIWLEHAEAWSSPALQQVVWVGATFCPRDRDQVFTTGVRPYPEIVGAARIGGDTPSDPRSYDRGLFTLFTGLQRVEAERRWDAFASRPGEPAPITAGRAEGMGRLALIHLARWLHSDRTPLLVPSDGGGRRSLAEIREHPAARIVARRGVRLAEPWTFALTRDELEAISDGPPPRLRYDDRPDVWRTMSDTDRGWLVRHEVHQAGLRGWLGLRVPYDGTAGVLLRTTGQLIGLSELERSVPCHGLLWSEDGAPTLNVEQRRLAQLAGLRLYQELVAILDRPPRPEWAEAARSYAIPFVLLVWRRAEVLSGTALELARRIELRRPGGSSDGSTVGTLDAWLRTPPALRPAADGIDPRELDAAAPPEPTDERPLVRSGPSAMVPTASVQAIERRILDAIGNPSLALRVAPVARPGSLDIAWIRPDSHRGRLVFSVNLDHAPVRRALQADGRSREVLLLELVRQACAFGAEHGREFDLGRAQQVLLAQRFGAE
ncbi:MAG: hypothetical protein ABMB14_20070, partial [Myxococcota bacterium]